MRFYCLHHTPAIDRKKYLLQLFYNQGLEVEWIEDFLPSSPEVINHSVIECIHAANGKTLNNAEISLYLKHMLVLEKIRTINDYGIIFEDDIQEPSWSIKEYLPKMIEQFENMLGNILWIGSDPILDIVTQEKIKIVSTSETKSRFAHCYMIHSNIANLVLDYKKNIRFPIDWQWNFTIDHFNLKSCWSYPSIYQRTATKEIASLLR
jgi:GR25 family glycosyltransferase involved in LPS biosynthesis